MADFDVNLVTLNEETETNDRLLPRTRAENVIETDEKQFISADLKSKINKKQDLLGYTPVNKAGDSMTGALLLLSNLFTEDNQAISKKYVDDKIKALVNSSPELLDTLYELAQAINNDPNFATTITNLISNKVSKSDTSVTAAVNKLIYTDADGNLPVNITGNASTANKLNSSFNLSLTGDINTTAEIDGSQDVNLNITLPRASADSAGIISSEDYKKINGITTDIKDQLGAREHNFSSSDFIFNSIDNVYTLSFIDENTKNIAFIKVYEITSDSINEILVNTEVVQDLDKTTLTIKSLKQFTGKVIYSFMS